MREGEDSHVGAAGGSTATAAVAAAVCDVGLEELLVKLLQFLLVIKDVMPGLESDVFP
jgi:hypothetical protein